jgi:hypothetical protein
MTIVHEHQGANIPPSPENWAEVDSVYMSDEAIQEFAQGVGDMLAAYGPKEWRNADTFVRTLTQYDDQVTRKETRHFFIELGFTGDWELFDAMDLTLMYRQAHLEGVPFEAYIDNVLHHTLINAKHANPSEVQPTPLENNSQLLQNLSPERVEALERALQIEQQDQEIGPVMLESSPRLSRLPENLSPERVEELQRTAYWIRQQGMNPLVRFGSQMLDFSGFELHRNIDPETALEIIETTVQQHNTPSVPDSSVESPDIKKVVHDTRETQIVTIQSQPPGYSRLRYQARVPKQQMENGTTSLQLAHQVDELDSLSADQEVMDVSASTIHAITQRGSVL